MEKPGGPEGAPRQLKPESLTKAEFAQAPRGDTKVARMGAKRKGCVLPFPTFWRWFFVPRTQRSA